MEGHGAAATGDVLRVGNTREGVVLDAERGGDHIKLDVLAENLEALTEIACRDRDSGAGGNLMPLSKPEMTKPPPVQPSDFAA